MKNQTVFFILFGLLYPGGIYAQKVNVKIGIKDSIQSTMLNKNRPLIVSLPNDYETSDQVYPVLFLLDGSERSLLEAMVVTDKLRTKMILVAITNTDRDRDMMPLSTPTYKVKDPGAENFLAFLEKELIPHIEKNYRTNG